RPSKLAAQLRVSKQALNYLLGELERLDYLERRPDPDDLRSKRVALTPRGASAISVIREAVDEMEAALAQQLGPKRFAQLRNLITEPSPPTEHAALAARAGIVRRCSHTLPSHIGQTAGATRTTTP